MKREIRVMFKNVVKLFYKTLWFFPVKKNKIVFSAFGARTYGDNPKYIAEKLLHEKSKYDLVFVLRNTNVELPKGIRKVKYQTIGFLYEMATAKIWIDNTRKETYIPKRKEQFYIQTWHAGLCLKKIEKDVEEKLAKSYVETAIEDSKKIDLLITNSDWGEEQLKRCFWYNGEILKTGSPRVDILFENNEQLKGKLKEQFKITDEKILLYAPTFRDDKDTKVYNIDYERLTNNLHARFKNNWKILVKLHPNISSIDFKLPENVIDCSKYPDINELFTISDVMITDYSSCIFDFSNLKKPIFLYATDLEKYQEERDTYFDLNELPFPLCKNNTELENSILNFNENEYLTKLNKFHKNMGLMEDGKATQRIVSIIKSEMEK